jgi:hypothetical protein
VSRAPASFEVLEEKKALKAGRCSPHPHQGRERRRTMAERTTGYMKRGIQVEQNEQRKVRTLHLFLIVFSSKLAKVRS